MRHAPKRLNEPPLSGDNHYSSRHGSDDKQLPDRECEAVFIPTTGSEEELARATFLSSLADLTVRGKVLAKITGLKTKTVRIPKSVQLVYSRNNQDLCGINFQEHKLRIGSLSFVEDWVRSIGGYFHNQVQSIVSQIIRNGGVALVVADEKRDLGVIYLKR